MSDKRTKWLIEAVSDTRAAQADLEKIISLLQKQNAIALEQQNLTQQQTTQTLLATQRQREAIENLSSTHSKGVTTQRTGLQALTGEYNALSKTLNGVTQLLAGAFIATSIKNYTMEVIAAKSAQDGFAVGLTNMLKSKVLADQINAQLMAIAVKSPFEVEQIQQVTTKLVGMGVEVNKIIPYITMLGEISAVVGTSKLPLIAKAMLDVMNKGVLMKQEINQFAENGVPLYDLLAASMEKPRKEIVKLAEAHKITFADVEKALKTATSEGGRYYGQMAAQAGTLSGQISNLSDRYTLAKASIGDFFENGIKRNIGLMADLIHETIGSQAAISRLMDAVKGAVASYVTYRIAVNSINAVMRANKVETMANLAAIEAASVAQVTMTGTTFSLTTAWNALKVAFISNPIGLVITAISTLATAMFAYKTLTAEVTDEQNAQSDALIKSHKEFEIATKAVMQHKEGTAQYKAAVDSLMATYPEYFAGISKEAVNNRVLNGVLMDINESFQERIRLANLAYKADQLTQKAIELDREQLEIIRELRKEYEGISKVNPNDEAFLNAVKGQQGVLAKIGNFLPGALTGGLVQSDINQAGDLINAKKAIEKELIKIKHDSEAEQTIITARSLDTQIQLLNKQLRDKEISQKEYNQAYLDLTNKTVNKTVEAAGDGEKKKQAAQKSSLELRLEGDLKILKSSEKTHENDVAIIEKKAELDKEVAKRTIKDKEDLAARIIQIDTAKNLALEQLEAKHIDKMIDYKMVDLKKLQAEADKEFQIRNTLADDIEDLTLHMNGLILKEEEEKAERIRQLGLEIFEAQKKLKDATFQLGELEAVQDAKIWQNKALVAERHWKTVLAGELDLARKQEAIAQAQYDKMMRLYGPDDELTRAALLNLEKAKTASTEALIAVKVNGEKIVEITKDDIIKIAQAAMAVMQMLVENYTESTRQAADSLDTVSGLIDGFVDKNREALQTQLSDVTLTNEQRETAIQESLNRESELVKRKSAMLTMRDQLTDLAERTESTMSIVQSGLNAVVSFAKGDFIGGMIGVVETINGLFNRAALNQIQQEMSVLREKQRTAQEKIMLIEGEIAARKKQLDEEVKALDEGYRKWKEINDKKAAEATQASEDQQLRVQNDDNFRARILEQAEARDIRLLQEARDREIVRATESGATAQELAEIKNSFEVLIKEKHEEYEDAKKDKSKAVSLAIQGIKNIEKDTLNGLKKDEKDEFDRVENSKKSLTADFTSFATNAQGQIFEQQKHLAILEIRMEIAKLKAQKRKWFSGKKALNAAISEMEGIINEITGGGGEVGDDWGNTGGGDGGGADNPNTGKPGGAPKFHGDTWLKRSNGEPYGLDTIPIMAHVGERIMQAYLNARLGPDVSNEELVDTYFNYQKMIENMPVLNIGANLALPTNIKQLHIPESRGNAADVLNAELQREIRGLRNALKGKMTNVIINTSGPTEIEQWSADNRRTYYDKLNR